MSKIDVSERSQEIFAEANQKIYVRTDRLFGALLLCEWVASIVLALVLSPTTWAGTHSSIHPHVFAAVVLGGSIIAVPVYFAWRHAGETKTRMTIAVAQMLFSALLIHLTGGRIETHFQIFGSLAFLAFYRDWRVLVLASTVVAGDHLLRGAFWPQTIYGVKYGTEWRWVEHAFWVVYEDLFLVIACRASNQQMFSIAEKQAELEELYAQTETHLTERTDQLSKSQDEVAFATEQLANIVNNSHEAIFSTDLTGCITSWNEAAAKLFRYEPGDVCGKPFEKMLSLQGDIAAKLSGVLTGATVVDEETACSDSQGNLLEVNMSMSPVRDASGKLIGMSGIVRDISQKKDADRRMAEFYSTVSHELRTPLTSIRGALSLVADGVIDIASDEATELIGIARASSVRLIRLINDILDLRKIEAGKLELHMSELEAKELVQQCVASMSGMALQKCITLEESVETDALLVADSDRLTQVLSNLISNAIKFSPPNSHVRVSVSISQIGMLRFSVCDKGAGIPAKDQHKLFGKFQQIDSSDTRANEGTGLGLAISRAIIEQHRGSMGFESTEGVGSTFWFEMPTVAGARTISTIDPSNPVVLIVEDDVALCKVIRHSMGTTGYECHAVHSKAEAFEYLSTNVPTVIIVDVGLPDGSGIEVVESVRSHPGLKHVPVIVMTGDTARNKFNLPAIFELIIKPFEPVQLLDALNRALVTDVPQRVLVVDDDDDARAVMCAQLRVLGLELLQASNGFEALRLIDLHTPDLIVLDVGMPYIDGFAVVDAMRRQSKIETPIVVYSGRDLTPEERESLQLGLTHYLTKGTVSEQDFVGAVRGVLEKITQTAGSKEIAA